MRAGGVGVAGCGGARCLGGGEQGGGGAGRPEVPRAGRRAGGLRGACAPAAKWWEGGCAAARGRTRRRGDAAAGPGERPRRRRRGRAGAGQGRGVSWPGGRGGLRRRGMPGGGRCTPPAASAPALAVRARRRLQRLGGGSGEGGRGWLHRGSHSASSSRRRLHCVLSAPVARCGALGGGRSWRPPVEDPVLASSPGGVRGAGPGDLGAGPCPGLARAPGRCGLRSQVHPRAAPSAPGPRWPGGPGGCVRWRAVPRGPQPGI